MFKHIKIEKGPIHSGKEFSFEKGTTAIVGPNGCGKSLLAEYISFSLFGSCALRGKISDYKDLSVTAWITIKGKDYKIERDTKNCKLYDETGGLICTGTKPCNVKIISLLGYDYNVYKMGNYAAQLDILGLGNMKPSERKTALDRTLGIGVIDKVIKYANDIALQYSHEGKAIRDNIRDPGPEPIKPEGYTDLNTLAEQYKELEDTLREYNLFSAVPKPVEPENPENNFSDVIKNNSAEYINNVLMRKTELTTQILNLQDVSKPAHTREEINQLLAGLDKFDQYKLYLMRIDPYLRKDKPKLSWEEYKDHLNRYREWAEYETKVKLYENSKITCPECGHTFSLETSRPAAPCVLATTYTESFLEEQRKLLENQDELNKIEKVEPVDIPPYNRNTLTLELFAWDKYDEKEKHEPELRKELESLPSFTSKDFQDRLDFDRKMASYQTDFAMYEATKNSYEAKANKFLGFDVAKTTEELQRIYHLYQACMNYDKDKSLWDERMSVWYQMTAEANRKEEQSNQYKQATENLKDMKVKIKGYVLPSLQKVSSLLLSEMSDGLFSDISISPDFDILVEGREINLFSGSEQAMINLALRLGLGQVLTHKVFSVFIGDEIDASMRDDRAQLTANCLRKISKYINQVILISHRDIEADHYIELNV